MVSLIKATASMAGEVNARDAAHVVLSAVCFVLRADCGALMTLVGAEPSRRVLDWLPFGDWPGGWQDRATGVVRASWARRLDADGSPAAVDAGHELRRVWSKAFEGWSGDHVWAVGGDGLGVARGWLVGFWRGPERGVFGPRERALSSVVVEGLEPMVQRLAEGEAGAAELEASLPPSLRSILRALVAGRSAKDISAETELTVATVQTYTKRLYKRVGVRSRPELLALAQRHGVVPATNRNR